MRLDLEYPTIIAASFDGVVVGVACSCSEAAAKEDFTGRLGGH